ncbi:MAG TPA: DUF4132 domain-containing protein, partial [Tepidisphaeraceae bacterium]|nr:DUF4132 domain-containing protein [Tepidisphaeraceae bacterium]
MSENDSTQNPPRSAWWQAVTRPFQRSAHVSLRACDAELGQLLEEYIAQFATGAELRAAPSKYETGRRLLDQSPENQVRIVYEVVPRLLGQRTSGSFHADEIRRTFASQQMLSALLRRPLPYEPAHLTALINLAADSSITVHYNFPVRGFLRAIARWAQGHGVLPEMRAALEKLQAQLRNPPSRIGPPTPDEQEASDTIDDILGRGGDEPTAVSIQPGEAWSDSAIADLAVMSPEQRAKWMQLFVHATDSEGSKPTKKWLTAARTLIEAVGPQAFVQRLTTWFPLIAHSRTQRKPEPNSPYSPDANLLIEEPHQDLLKGLAWCAATITGDALVAKVSRALGDGGEASFKKVPNLGARSVKIGNACVYALGVLPGDEPVAQLSRLATKVKQPSARKMVAKTLSQVAQKTGVTVDDLAEMALPDFGLDIEGRRRETFGNFTATIHVQGDDVACEWSDASGKARKSIPAEMKRDHADELKALKRLIKEIQTLAGAQRIRVEKLFAQDRTWSFEDWHKRYLNHPLLAGIARRLIWEFRTGERVETAIWLDGKLIDRNDKQIDAGASTRVSLWHPISAEVDTVLQWREFLERHEIRQPFKQAHREVYKLTDAELTTDTYSNRFAAHIVRQHMLVALCQQRGWSAKLQGMWDPGTDPTPTLKLPALGISASYWVELMEGGRDEPHGGSGVSLYVRTDQVRFTREGEFEPMHLADVPPKVFSEVMRDVDLFVAVSSVGNDVNWHDRGDAIGAYWHDFSFGDLSATAQTRREVLQRLIPRLKIADRCSFTARFLVVRGDKRTYKIHLGSGNILMEPNDQYLCIVPDMRVRSKDSTVYLPFEG